MFENSIINTSNKTCRIVADPNVHSSQELNDGFVCAVKNVISQWFMQEKSFQHVSLQNSNPASGKMLRTLLVQHLSNADGRHFDLEMLANACAAIELVHAATLFHDDVIDAGEIRRGEPSLWRQTSTSGSILIGDLYLCGAIDLLTRKGDAIQIARFIEKMRETCTAEIQQELVLRGTTLDRESCIRIARGKTGPLFGFGASLCSGPDVRLHDALEEVGYIIGTAYQLADDLIDEKGDPFLSSKTLGTDRLRRKYTLASDGVGNGNDLVGLVDSLCEKAVDLLLAWPEFHASLLAYLKQDFYPVLHAQCKIFNAL